MKYDDSDFMMNIYSDQIGQGEFSEDGNGIKLGAVSGLGEYSSDTSES
jgi:hypothetical protein